MSEKVEKVEEFKYEFAKASEKIKDFDEYKIQYYPGSDKVSERRRKLCDKSRRLVKFRAIPDDNLVLLLGHRLTGESYVSVHPPLDELVEKYDPIKEVVDPTPGARAGDRIRFIQFTDSVYYPPIAPWLRTRMYLSRYRGIDTVVYSSRHLLEMRERDLEATSKQLLETEVFNPARTAIRGITVHGSSLRLSEEGLMFDARRRYKLEEETGEVVYTKNQHAYVLDLPISVGRPLTERESRRDDVTYRWDAAPFGARTEVHAVLSRYIANRVLSGFNPELTDEINKLH
ncbi:MAG: coenzyme-B sulfoethylthiotransferase subunit gamma [Halobacteriota archaeon]|nr:coenzyme-B sulfoethylthiotransferase subunit gamma [Halobacteriota archaeon]